MTKDERAEAMNDITTASAVANAHAERLLSALPNDGDALALALAVGDIASEAAKPYPDLARIADGVSVMRSAAARIDGGANPERAKPEFTSNEAARHELDRVRNLIGAVSGNVTYILDLNKEGD